MLADFAVDGNAEIVVATPDGLRLIHTNPERGSIDIVDISDTAKPALLARVDMPGEPTSVALSPDGQWALAVVRTSGASKSKSDPRLPGVLALIDIRNAGHPAATAWIGIGPEPDSIVVTNAGKELIAVIAVENMNTDDGDDDDGSDDDNPVEITASYAGTIQTVTVYPANPDSYRINTLRLSRKLLRDAGMIMESLPQPESVALSPDRSVAAISLQRNNGIVLIDPYLPNVIRAFSTGRVNNRKADLTTDGVISLTEDYPDAVTDNDYAGLRFPDGLAFTSNGQFILSADEGTGRLTGGRGFSVWTVNGDFVWDDGGEIERIAAERGYYDDKRSAHKGIEMESVTAARFGTREFAFAVAERGAFMVIYDISDPRMPVFVDMLPSGEHPESVIAIPSRGLIAVAAEKSGELTLYGYATGD